MNQERIALVKTLRAEFGEQFIGGVVADPFARQLCPDVLADRNIYRSSYLELAKQCIVGVYSRGLHHSLAFKLSEYLAAGLCIVSEPLKHQLPVPLEAGTHYLPFTTHAECVAHCRRLLTDAEEASRMREANQAYYRKWVEPKAHSSGRARKNLSTVIAKLLFRRVCLGGWTVFDLLADWPSVETAHARPGYRKGQRR